MTCEFRSGLEEIDVAARRSVGGSMGLLAVGSKREGGAAAPSRVSKGK